MEPVPMTVSSYLLTPPRSLEQVIAELTRNQANDSSLNQRDIAPDADQNAEAKLSSAF
jgi:hypothetical protein